MEIVLFSRPRVNHTAAELRRFITAVSDCGMKWRLNEQFAERIGNLTGIDIPTDKRYASLSETELATDAIIVCYGGDGTFLEAVRRLNGRSVPMVGINRGRLGFLASIPADRMEEAFAGLRQGAYTTQQRSLLQVEGDFPEAPAHPFAFNEFTIQRNTAEMIDVETYAGDDMIANYRGDGIILSTPSGSTAYSHSVGGPIVAPECNCFILTPIAPHNLSMRPVVIPDTIRIVFRVTTRSQSALATLDNMNYTVPNGASFTVSKAKKSINLIQLQNISFYDTLRNKMMWGLDKRDLDNNNKI